MKDRMCFADTLVGFSRLMDGPLARARLSKLCTVFLLSLLRAVKETQQDWRGSVE
jgi:hypothetical protein